MVTSTLWRSLRHALGHKPSGLVTVQRLVLSERDEDLVQALLDRAGVLLGLRFELRADDGDLVLLDGDLVDRMSPQLIAALREDRPELRLSGLQRWDQRPLSPAQRIEHHQAVLLEQLRAIPLVRQRSALPPASGWAAQAPRPDAEPANAMAYGPSTGFDSGFDSTIDAVELAAEDMAQAQRALVQQVLRGRLAATVPSLAASYGPEANLLFDFRNRIVVIDPLAQQHLRVRRELPQPAPGASPRDSASVRSLDEVVWDLGIASGDAPLLGAAEAWWYHPLVLSGRGQVDHFSRVPRHLELERCLLQGPATPSQLRRRARVSVDELRRFLQAGLMTGLLTWLAASPDAE